MSLTPDADWANEAYEGDGCRLEFLPALDFGPSILLSQSLCGYSIGKVVEVRKGPLQLHTLTKAHKPT